MKYQTNIDEILFVSAIVPERSYMFDHDLKTGLSIVWNTGKEAHFMIDQEEVTIHKDCIIFLTEYHNIDAFHFEEMNVIQFNRQFYCVEEDTDLGCKGLLFFGGAQIPKITIPTLRKKEFQTVWNALMHEIDTQQGYKLEMLKSLLQQFLILSVRVYKKQDHDLPLDDINMNLIREYNYLVEKYYATYTKVSDYARLLHKSPKTLSNIFKMYIDKTPIQLINERRLLEAKRKLTYTTETIQTIADLLNFKDVQSFSHFFKDKTGLPPSHFRNNHTNSRE
ncbi:MAG: helix-turn-helix domain-containing protein [Saprospiraceae bacterium]|nr:helix-turn-helix domain-containing protein [Saprospiraceae bacterium]